MNWRRNHLPSPRIIRSTFVALGLSEVKDLKVKQRVFRSLPVSTDSSSRLWHTGDGSWVAGFLDDSETADPLRVFCHPCTLPPGNWIPSPWGWEGFEQLIGLIENRPKASPSSSAASASPGRGKSPLSRDPRELVF